MRVDINNVKQRLIESFKVNSFFNERNIDIDNTVEDKIFAFVLKFQEIFNFNLDNFYEKLKTLKIERLSVYSNNGLVSYDADENIGKISLIALENDEENKYNIDNLFSQIMLMTATSKDNYYGFSNERLLDALNKSCTYMIASNISGSSEINYTEEGLMILNMLDKILTGTSSRIDFVTAYLSNNGTILKKELNDFGITDSTLNKINYLQEAIMNKLNVPDIYANIVREIDNCVAKLIYDNRISDDNIISGYESNLLNNNVMQFSRIGVEEERIRMTEFIERNKKRNNIVNINDYNKPSVMQKAS